MGNLSDKIEILNIAVNEKVFDKSIGLVFHKVFERTLHLKELLIDNLSIDHFNWNGSLFKLKELKRVYLFGECARVVALKLRQGVEIKWNEFAVKLDDCSKFEWTDPRIFLDYFRNISILTLLDLSVSKLDIEKTIDYFVDNIKGFSSLKRLILPMSDSRRVIYLPKALVESEIEIICDSEMKV